jgi:hypothetical protein
MTVYLNTDTNLNNILLGFRKKLVRKQQSIG